MQCPIDCAAPREDPAASQARKDVIRAMKNRNMKTTCGKKSPLLWVGLLCLSLLLCACDSDGPRTEEQSSAAIGTEAAADTNGDTHPLPEGDTAEEESGSENATDPAEDEDTAHKDTEEPTVTEPEQDTEKDSETDTAPEDGEATTENPEIELPKVEFD